MPQSHKKKPTDWVSDNIIRQQFNKSQIFEQAKSGKLKTKVKRSSHLKNPPPTEPYCTYSQILFYSSQKGKPLAIVHQYLRPDGTIGASGRPDPKVFHLPNRILAVKTPKKK